jgi:hypothetical protein
MESQGKIYLIVYRRDDQSIGHALSFEIPTEEGIAKSIAEKFEGDGKDKESKGSVPNEKSFREVIGSFVSSQTYRNIIPITLTVAPEVSAMIAAEEIEGFAKDRGVLMDGLGGEKARVYELSKLYLGAFMQRHESGMAAVKGASHLPEIAVIGLISIYDAYLAKLLGVAFRIHEEIVFTADKEIRYDDIRSYKSIEELKEHIIDDEVENILRTSHQAQFAWMEGKFKIGLKANLDVWPSFV